MKEKRAVNKNSKHLEQFIERIAKLAAIFQVRYMRRHTWQHISVPRCSTFVPH